MAYSHKGGPSIGKILEVKPTRVSNSGELRGTNPSNWSRRYVVIEKENLDTVLPDDVLDAMESDRGPFPVREVDEPHPAEVVKKDRGLIHVKFLPEDSLPIEDESESIFETPQREESLDVEWEGTPQKSDPDRVKRRKEAVKGDDPRGSKNDLL